MFQIFYVILEIGCRVFSLDYASHGIIISEPLLVKAYLTLYERHISNIEMVIKNLEIKDCSFKFGDFNMPNLLWSGAEIMTIYDI